MNLLTQSSLKNIGFPTIGEPIADLAYKSNMNVVDEYYEKHLDGMIAVD